MAKYERISKVAEPKVVEESPAVVNTDAVDNIIAKEKFVKYDQATVYAKGHNFKDTITEVKNSDPFKTQISSNASLRFPLCSINYLSQRMSQEEVGMKISCYVGDMLVKKVYLSDGKDDQKILAVLNKSVVVNYSPEVKYALDQCKTGEEFKIIRDNINCKLKALMSDTEVAVSQYGDELVVVLDPDKVVETVIIPSQLEDRSNETLSVIKQGKVKIAKRQLFFAIKTENALGNIFDLLVGEKNFVACDLTVPYDRFMSQVPDVFNHFYKTTFDEKGVANGNKLVRPIPTVKYFDVLKIVGADVRDSVIRRQMLGILEAPVAKAPIIKLDKSYLVAFKKTGNPLLDDLYEQQSAYTKVETELNTAAIMDDFGFLLDGEVHTYTVGSDNYLLVDTKKLFVATMFKEFYNHGNNNFKFKITVNPDASYGIGCTMSI